jgi:type I restriction enzyme S subunit
VDEGPHVDKITLKDLCRAIVDCEHKTAPTQSDGIPLIRTPDIANGRLNLDSANRVSEETYREWSKRLEPEASDLILAREAPIGEVGMVQRGQRVCLGQRTVLIRADENKVYPRYLLYLLCTSKMKRGMNDLAGGSVVPHLNMHDIRNLSIPQLPHRDVQKAIAEHLGALDDKIELLMKQNRILEKIGKVLFKRWFIDFEFPNEEGRPYKSSGGELIESELGKIPTGWLISNLGDIVQLAYGKPLKEESRQPGKVAVYGSNGPIGLHSKALVRGPGIIIGRKGNPGKVTFSTEDFFPIDTTFYVIPKAQISSIYFLFHVLSLQDLESLNADSAVPGLNRNVAYLNKILVPPSKIVQAFDVRIGNTIYNKISINTAEIYTLSLLRDSLLPKLISGKFRIPLEAK